MFHSIVHTWLIENVRNAISNDFKINTHTINELPQKCKVLYIHILQETVQ